MAQHLASRTRTQDSVPGLLGSALGLVALVLAVLAAVVLIIVPMATGSQTYSVLTNSMRPHLPPGTLIISRPVAFQDLRIGDVVTYQLESGRADVITHRIVSTAADQEGNTLLITQGDNNDLPDEAPVREIQVRGKLFYAVPYAGFLANWLGNQDRGLGAQIAAVVLIGYGAWNVVSGMLARRRTRSANDAVAGSRETADPVSTGDGTRMPAALGQHTSREHSPARHLGQTPHRSGHPHRERISR